MRLTGALSNLDVSDSLDAAVGGKRGIAVPVPTRSSRPRLLPRLGAIQGTILNVLDEAGRAMGAREVRGRDSASATGVAGYGVELPLRGITRAKACRAQGQAWTLSLAIVVRSGRANLTT